MRMTDRYITDRLRRIEWMVKAGRVKQAQDALNLLQLKGNAESNCGLGQRLAPWQKRITAIERSFVLQNTVKPGQLYTCPTCHNEYSSDENPEGCQLIANSIPDSQAVKAQAERIRVLEQRDEDASKALAEALAKQSEAETKLAGFELAVKQLRATLYSISTLGGNLPDERLEEATGPNDAVHRGILYTTARTLAKQALGE